MFCHLQIPCKFHSSKLYRVKKKLLESGFAIFSRNSSAKVLVMHQKKEKNKWHDNAFLQQSNSIEIAWE